MHFETLTIGKVGPQGDGISSGSPARVFVERGLPGDQVQARIFHSERGVTRAEILKVLKPSAFRQAAPCAHYDRCGNCTLQHLIPSFYKDWKQSLLKETLLKHGLRPQRWGPPVFVPEGTRRRATFSAYRQRNQLVLGYFKRRSQQIFDLEMCAVVAPRILDVAKKIKPFLSDIVPSGERVDIFIQTVGDAIDIAIAGNLAPNARDGLAIFAKENAIARISHSSGERGGLRTLVARGSVTAEFGAIKVQLPSGAFLQATIEAERALVDTILSALPRSGRFADLFSGCGTFSGPMLSRGPVDAYESLPSAVSALAKASVGKELRAFRRDLYRHPLKREEINRYDAIVFDPPRAGAPELAEALGRSKTRTVIGVSCNPATFARDARILCDGGFWLQSVQMIDQFRWSHHCEVIGVFSKEKRR